MSPVPGSRLLGLVLLAQVPGILAVATLLALEHRGARERQPQADAVPALVTGEASMVAQGMARPGPPGFTPLEPVHDSTRHATPLGRADFHGALPAYATAPAGGWITLADMPRVAPPVRLWESLQFALLPFALLLPLLLAGALRLARSLRWAAADPQGGASPAPVTLARPIVATATPARRRDIQHALLQEAENRQAAIARELHDAVGSSLAGVSLLLGTARSFTREPEADALIATSQEQVARITQHIRQISRGIMPAGQEDGALLPALEHFATEMSTIRGIRCSLNSRGSFEHLSAEVGGHLFRIVQEATNNALRHGHATRVRIVLVRSRSRSRLTVRDDGRGCDVAAVLGHERGFGLRSMRARAEQIGGTFRLDARAGHGARVQVTWSSSPAGIPDQTKH